MTKADAEQLCSAYGATFVKRAGAIDWWKLPDGTFLGVKNLDNGLVEVRRVSADACGCT